MVEARFHVRPGPGVRAFECKPDIEPSKDPNVRKSACEAGDIHACHRLIAEDHPTEALTATALTTLESACKDLACACALHGSALTYDPRKRYDDRALAILDKACSSGAMLACDELTLLAELCSSERAEDRVLCARLRQAGLARPPPPPSPPELVAATLPEYLRDCFVVVRDLGADRCEPRPRAGEGSGAICEIDPEACPKSPVKAAPCATRALGAVYCFGPDRVLRREPTVAEWQEKRTDWRVLEGDARFVAADFAVRLDGRDALLDGRYRLFRADDRTRASATRFVRFRGSGEKADYSKQ